MESGLPLAYRLVMIGRWLSVVLVNLVAGAFINIFTISVPRIPWNNLEIASNENVFAT